MIRTILTEGHPTLNAIARDVTDDELKTPELQQIIDDMISTLKSTTGVGLAAPQIGESLRIVIVDKPMTVLINPLLTPVGETKDTSYEGCLSIPGMRGEVERHQAVHVEYTDRAGKRQEATWVKFRAIVVQHEVDHLNGILYSSRASFMYPDDTQHAPKLPQHNLTSGTPRQNGGRTFVIDSDKKVGGQQHFTFTFMDAGRLSALRIAPGGAMVTAVYLTGVRLRASGFKAGAVQRMLLGVDKGLHVAQGDQLRIELRLPSGRHRIVAEADFDYNAPTPSGHLADSP